MKESKIKFSEYKDEGANWITLATGEFYSDILVDACNLYRSVLELFSQLLKSQVSHPPIGVEPFSASVRISI